MRNFVRVVMLVGLIACGSGKPAPASAVPANSTAPDCGSTAAVIVRALADEDAKNEASAVTTAITKRCTDDKWTADAVNCLGAAHDKGGLHDCGYQHLTQAQQDKLDEATAALSATSMPRLMKQMAKFRDQMCACKDAKCAEGVADDLTRWSQDVARSSKEPPKMREEQTKQAATLGEEMGKCMQAAMGAGGLGGSPPAPPTPL